MWNWLVSGLAAEATLVLYDGSPFHPGPEALFDYIDAHQINIFGTSAKYIDAVKKSGLIPKQSHGLSSLRAMLSTGSPLVPESFDFVYDAIKADLHLASISGGTDIIGCFVLGNPYEPVWRGEIQGPALGMDISVFDDDGNALEAGKGELVCLNPFPSMPVGFWNDPDGARYHGAYFAKFNNVWCHGDYVEWTRNGGMVIHGRSDAVLNPVVFELEPPRSTDRSSNWTRWSKGWLLANRWTVTFVWFSFVRLADGVTLDDALQDKIRKQIRANATPRHVPARILSVPDIPRTKSGKIVELAVRNVVHGDVVKNKEALANPEALAHFANRPELAS